MPVSSLRPFVVTFSWQLPTLLLLLLSTFDFSFFVCASPLSPESLCATFFPFRCIRAFQKCRFRLTPSFPFRIPIKNAFSPRSAWRTSLLSSFLVFRFPSDRLVLWFTVGESSVVSCLYLRRWPGVEGECARFSTAASLFQLLVRRNAQLRGTKLASSKKGNIVSLATFSRGNLFSNRNNPRRQAEGGHPLSRPSILREDSFPSTSYSIHDYVDMDKLAYRKYKW